MTASGRTRLLILAGVSASLLVPGAVAGQSASAVGRSADPAPPWLSRWRPLDMIGDLPRTLPASQHRFPNLLTRPTPRVGQFWSVGNPAALALELEDTRADFSVSYADDDGDYRRPLDPGSEAQWTMRGTGWRPLEEHGAVIGHMSVQQSSLGDGVFSDVLVPYGASPFFVMDTIGDGKNRTLARIEGAGGWQLGALSVGLGFGYESQDTRTKTTNVPRTNRTATPGATGGLVWSLPGERVSIGIHGRWQQTAQTVSVFSIGAPSRIYAPDGFTEPVAFDLNGGTFFRRFERTAWAAGASVAGRVGLGTWVAYGQREWLSEDRFSPRTNDPLRDAWDADGWTFGGAAAIPLGALSLSLDSRFTTLDGEGVRGDIELLSFTSEDRVFAVDGEARWQLSERWEAAARGGVRRESRDRGDLIEQVAAKFTSWSPSVAAEIARYLSRRLALSVGGSIEHYSPTSATPDPSLIGPAYEKWIAPELGLLATKATGWAARGTLHFQLTDRNAVWLSAQYRSVSPAEPDQPLPDTPRGDRESFFFTVGATLAPP